jgi:hypothetical protein
LKGLSEAIHMVGEGSLDCYLVKDMVKGKGVGGEEFPVGGIPLRGNTIQIIFSPEKSEGFLDQNP